MKRCPECKKNYLDDSLMYCLDDGASLVQGSVTDEPATAILSSDTTSADQPTRLIDSADSSPISVGSPASGRNWWKVGFVLVALVAAGLATLFFTSPQNGSAGAPLRRFALNIPSESAPNWNDFSATISPDGSRIAYNCREGNAVSICIRDLDNLQVRKVAEGRDATGWFFSPDGEWLGIVDEVKLSKVSIHGGSPQTIYRWPETENPTGFNWGPDGSILFGTASGIWRVSSSGGATTQVTRTSDLEGIKAHDLPSHLPDGRSILITIARKDANDTAGIVDLKDGSLRDLGVNGYGFVYLDPGWIAFKQGTSVLAFAFDPARPSEVGDPVPVVQNVRGLPRVSREGTLVYVPLRGDSKARLVWVDRDGRATPVGTDRLEYTHLDLASDGRRALLNLEGSIIDLIDLQGGTRKLVAKGGFPIWSSDGQRVTFAGDGGIQWAPADGSSAPEMLVPHNGFVVPTSWNTKTGELAYYDHRSFEIWIRSPDGRTRRLLGEPGRKRSARFSPDGKWMAFVSDETGDYQVYVTAYPGPGSTVAVSTKGGLSPIWSSDGRELYFRLGSKLLVSRMTNTQPPAFETPVELFDGPFTLDLMGHQREDVESDGHRFLMVENSDDFPIIIVQNWPVELKRLIK